MKWIELRADNPDQRDLDDIVDVLKSGGVIIYPTDTVYALGCDSFSTTGVEKLYEINGGKSKESGLSLICSDFSQVSNYVLPIERSHFKILKKHLPGPYTFIFEANTTTRKRIPQRRKTIGIRIPDSSAPKHIVEALGRPLLSSSLKKEDGTYYSEVYEIFQDYEHKIPVLVDGGTPTNSISTVVDMTQEEPEVLREGSFEFEG